MNQRKRSNRSISCLEAAILEVQVQRYALSAQISRRDCVCNLQVMSLLILVHLCSGKLHFSTESSRIAAGFDRCHCSSGPHQLEALCFEDVNGCLVDILQQQDLDLGLWVRGLRELDSAVCICSLPP